MIILGLGLMALGMVGFISLAIKEFPLALFGKRTSGVVTKVEVITTSTGSDGILRSGKRVGKTYGSDLTFMYIDFTTTDGQPMQIKTLATFNTEAKVGDQHPLIYMASNPQNAKIYSARQLWMPMIIGIIFSSACLFGGLWMVRPRISPVQ